MDDRYRGVSGEDLEELESVDDAAELEGEGGVGLVEPVFEVPPSLRDLERSGARNLSPMALLDASLHFLYRNPPLNRLLRKYRYPENSLFLGTFARSLDQATMREIHDALSGPHTGWAWEGDLVHRSRDSAAIVTKVIIMPLWLSDDVEGKPGAFTVSFHDVTQENKYYLRQAFDSLLKASLKKDNDTGKHIERVNRYARRLTEALFRDPRWPEVDVDFIEDIGFLAAMHDVGKIGTPDDILNKNGPLTESEWKIMKEHTINGAFILDGYPNPMAKQIALSHHEWWNGSGYPFNLVEKMIPLSARIVTITDVYDALRMRRSYKPPYEHAVAVEKIVAERGVHFDPDLVDAFLTVTQDFARIYHENAD